MAETIAIITIVGLALFYSARRFYRTFSRANKGCDCGHDCPVKNISNCHK